MIFGSDWEADGLNPNLVCHIRPVDYDGNPIGDDEVRCLVIDQAPEQHQENWQSPFENIGPESKAPAIAAMLQSGALAPLAAKLKDAAGALAQSSGSGSLKASVAGSVAGAAGQAQQSLLDIRGRTGVSKINSTQIHSGSSPVKLAWTLYFKAYKSPLSEVVQPVETLLKWKAPQKLSPDGVIVGAVSGSNGQSGILNNLLPSSAPMLLNVRYGGYSYLQMVIESAERNMNAPRDKYGNFIEMAMSVSFASLTALDRDDLVQLFSRQNDFKSGNTFGRTK